MHSAKMDHEYSPIGGAPDFGKLAAELAFGEGNEVQKNKLVEQSYIASFLHQLYSWLATFNARELNV